MSIHSTHIHFARCLLDATFWACRVSSLGNGGLPFASIVTFFFPVEGVLDFRGHGLTGYSAAYRLSVSSGALHERAMRDRNVGNMYDK